MASIKQSDYETLAAFRYALRQFMRFSEEAAQAVGLTPHQHQALLAIRGFPDGQRITVGELAERLQIRHHSAVELVNRLALEDLVVRQVAEEDRRRVYVSLTRRGENILEKLSSVHKQELRRIGPQLKQMIAVLTGDS
ncbi:MAG TPA: MarR family transcriptional regulator [Anaerolineales bacterium]|nr:MarR family transcriptional regulator [Anaerolineales bacterium]